MFKHAVKAHRVITQTFQPPSETADDDNEYADNANDDDNAPARAADVIDLEPLAAELNFGDALQAQRRLCAHLQRGVAAVLGPMSATAAQHCTNVCDAKDVPYVDFRWDAAARPPVINMMPHPEAMAQVFVALVRAWNWNGFTILYESGELCETCDDFLAAIV